VKIYNRYILTITILLLVTTVVLAALGQNSLKFYYILYLVEALIVTELYVHFSAKARHELNLVSSVLLVGFLAVLSLEIIKILA